MEQDASTPGTRRDQDIALDLLKFVASTTSVIRPTTASTGFTAPTTPKPEDQVNVLLGLYTRCLRVVQGVDEKAPEAPMKGSR